MKNNTQKGVSLLATSSWVLPVSPDQVTEVPPEPTRLPENEQQCQPLAGGKPLFLRQNPTEARPQEELACALSQMAAEPFWESAFQGHVFIPQCGIKSQVETRCARPGAPHSSSQIAFATHDSSFWFVSFWLKEVFWGVRGEGAERDGEWADWGEAVSVPQLVQHMQ